MCIFISCILYIFLFCNISNISVNYNFDIIKLRLSDWFGYILVLSYLLVFWLGFFSFYFTFCYVRIHNDRIEFRNIFSPFFSKEYHYSSLTNHYVRIATYTPGSRYIYETRNISIIKKGKKYPCYFKNHYIRLVSQDDLKKIAEILQSKGVEIDIKLHTK